METWKEIKFEFDTVDKLDVQPQVTCAAISRALSP